MSLISTLEADAAKVLHFLSGAETEIQKVGPTVIAGLGTILGAVSTAITDGEGAAAAGGLNIALDVQTAADVKAVWPDLVKFAESLGVKL